MELVGRDDELARIGRACHAASEGQQRAIGIVGEAGIGKSALLDELAAAANDRGLTVLRGRAAEHERTVPFALAIDALDAPVAALHPRRVASVAPELGAVLPAAAVSRMPAPLAGGPAERFRYHRALRELLEQLGRERPIALVLDDVHWADEASVEFILHLLRRVPQVGFLIGFALRPAAVSSRLLDAARRSIGSEELRLAPLDRDAALRLLPADIDPAQRDRMLRDADGNPLFLNELARLGAGKLPGSLVAVVRQELDELPLDARTFAWGAAVAGDPFELEVAEAAADVDQKVATSALDAVAAVDLIRTTDETRVYRFRHPLVHRAIYDAAPPGWRLLAHERAETVLARRGADPVELAYHVEQFARHGDAGAVSRLRAAAESTGDRSPAGAAHWYRAALRLLAHDETAERVRLLVLLAHALTCAGRLDEGLATLDECLALLPEGAEERADLILAAASIDYLLGDLVAADRRLHVGLDEFPAQFRLRVMLWHASAASFAGDVSAVNRWAESAARELGDRDDPVPSAAVAAVRGIARALAGDPAADLIDDAARGLATADDAALAAYPDATFIAALGFGQVERYRDALTVMRRYMRFARAARQDHMVPGLHTRIAMLQQPLLDLDDALAHAEAAEEGARLLRLDHELASALCQRARILALRGDHAEAERAAIESDLLLPAYKPLATTYTSLADNAVVRLGADPEHLLAALDDIAGSDLHRVLRWTVNGLLLIAVRAAIALDRLDDADRWAQRATALANHTDLPASAVRGARSRAEALLARGNPIHAAQIATAAIAEAERHGFAQEALGARILAGRALLATGDEPQRATAVDHLQRAATDAARAAAVPEYDAAARELRRAGLRVSAQARRAENASERGTLTKREHDIAELVAGGHTNKQVAATLYISGKTVEANLSRVYAKLGVRSRTELANAMR
jgi:DNA-binding CsgD family transcriptional regulator